MMPSSLPVASKQPDSVIMRGSSPSSTDVVAAAMTESTSATGTRMSVAQDAAICQCLILLDPFKAQNTFRLTASELNHFCRVCNTQLNSCKQTRIHIGGKKHGKRLAFLKLSMETTANDPEPPPTEAEETLVNNFATQCIIGYPAPSYPTHTGMAIPTTFSQNHPPPAPLQQPTLPIYYNPTNQFPQVQQQVQYPYFPPAYEYQQPVYQQQQPEHYYVTPPGQPAPPPQAYQWVMVMDNKSTLSSPNVTTASSSGFGGSLTDGKSLDSGSILSSSSSEANPGNIETTSRSKKQKQSCQSMISCDVCLMSFASKTVYESHLSGRKHAKKLAAAKDSVELGDVVNVNEIKCEICQVAVNSSNQLQSHLKGYKHRARCLRLGLSPLESNLSQSSCTKPDANQVCEDSRDLEVQEEVAEPELQSKVKSEGVKSGARPATSAAVALVSKDQKDQIKGIKREDEGFEDGQIQDKSDSNDEEADSDDKVPMTDRKEDHEVIKTGSLLNKFLLTLEPHHQQYFKEDTKKKKKKKKGNGNQHQKKTNNIQ